MLKKILAVLAMLYAAACFAAVDVNKATAAELDSVKGIGPAISGKILDERKKSSFKDWDDLVKRVKGVGDKNAVKFSAAGLTVDGATYKGVAAAPAAASKDAKPAPMAKDVKPAPMAKDVKSAAMAKDVKSAASAAKPASSNAK